MRHRRRPAFPLFTMCVVAFLASAVRMECGEKKDAVQYGAGLTVNIPAPEAEVLRAVEEVVQDGIIRGSKEYNKDEYISGATEARESHLFPVWNEGGKVFYKVRLHALDPRNFKDSADVGTLAVRYIVMAQNDKNTVLRVDAVFVEDFRHKAHPSNGSVENAEYKDIRDHIEAFEALQQEAESPTKQKQQPASESASVSSQTGRNEQMDAASPAGPAPSSGQSLEERVHELRKQVERLVRTPGAPLKSAPFHTASNLQSLPAGAEVLIVISTPYWYGVETHDGQHGWMLRDELEELP